MGDASCHQEKDEMGKQEAVNASCLIFLADTNDAGLPASSPPLYRKTGSAGVMVQPVNQPPCYFLIQF